MNKKTSILLSSILLLLVSFSPMQAFDLDETVDDEIRKKYNSNLLLEEHGLEKLPDLPDVTILETNTFKQENNTPIVKTKFRGKINKYSSFDVINNNSFSNWTTKGTKITFKLNNSTKNKKYILPANTVFIGQIEDVHPPQISGNGGLIILKINSIKINNKIYSANGYITRANDKKIFFNNIKGERKYLSTLWKDGNWGRTLFNKMATMSVNLGQDGATLLFSPFPVAYGTICLGVNALASPITAFFSKGGNLSFKQGTEFRIKILNDIYIN